jgi:hypothetical protein
MADALSTAIARADGRAVADALHGLSEAQRRERAPELLELARKLDHYAELRPDGSFGPLGDDDAAFERSQRQLGCLQLAVNGTATLNQLRRVGDWGALVHLDEELGAEVMLDRRPAWLAHWADWVLTAEAWNPKWPLVHRLVLAGAIERPADPAYLDALLRSSYVSGAAPALAREPGLAWELLAFHGGGASLRSADDHGAGWREAIIACTEDRDGLLDAALDALSSDLTGHRAAWYTGLWKALKPTAKERAARADRLQAALGAAAAPIIGFAAGELLKAKVDVPPNQLAPALAAPAKRTVRTALKLLDRSPDAAAALIALGHDAADIQDEVLDRLEPWGVPHAELLARLDLLAATVRPRAEALLGVIADAREQAPEVDTSAIPEAIRHALNFGGPVPEAPVPGEPVLGEPVVPIASREELFDQLVAAAAGQPAGFDERVLDGILRFCAEPFDEALAKRLDEAFWPGSVLRVAHAWYHRRNEPLHGHPREWDWRLHEAAERAAAGDSRPLLALPTHAGGWIAPSALLARLRHDPDEHELAQALLRLAPDGRAEALEHARDIPGRTGRVLRCALGGEAVGEDGPAAAAALAIREPPVTTIRFAIRVAPEQSGFARLQVARETSDPQSYRKLLGSGPVGEQLKTTTPEITHGVPSLDLPGEFDWPARRDVAAAAAIARIGANLESGSFVDTGAAPLLDNVLAPTEPLCPLVLRLTTLALCSVKEAEHLRALDLLVAGIEDGRVDAANLALGEDLAVVITTRLATRLATLAQTGPLHRAVVRDALARLALDALPARRRNPLVRLLDELRAEPVDAERLLLAARVRRAQRWIG